MKRIAIWMAALLLLCGAAASAQTNDGYGSSYELEERMLRFPVTLVYSQDDQSFYEACFENARQNMDNPERDDPEYLYRNQAQSSQEASEGERKWLAKNGMLFDWAAEDDLPRDMSVLIGYAALDQLAQMPREEMEKYYAESWMNISNPDRRIWQVYMKMASGYRRTQEDAVSYCIYIDAGTGEIVGMEIAE